MRKRGKIIALALSVMMVFPYGMSVVNAQEDILKENIIEEVGQSEETVDEGLIETVDEVEEKTSEKSAKKLVGRAVSNTISPEMSKSEVDQVIKDATDTIQVESGDYGFGLTFNSGKDVEILGHITVQGTVVFENCTVNGNGYTLNIGTGLPGDGLDIAGQNVTIKNATVLVNSSRDYYATHFQATTVNLENSTLNSSNNPKGAGLFIGIGTKEIITKNSDLIMCGNGKDINQSGIWSNGDGNPNIIFNMEGGTLQLDNNALNGFLGLHAPIFSTAPTPTFNLHNVNVSASGNGYNQDPNSRGDGFSYGYINLTSDTGEHTFNVNGNSNNGIDGGIGNNCAFNAENYTINANNNGGYGIHISKKTSEIKDCKIVANKNGKTGFYSGVQTTLNNSSLTAESNGQQGVQVNNAFTTNNSSVTAEYNGQQGVQISGAFTTNNSSVTANANEQNGIKVTGETNFNDSDITANENIMSGIYTSKALNVAPDSSMLLMLNTSKASGKGALYVEKGTATIQKGAEVSITENYQSGVYVGDGGYTKKPANVDMQTGEIYKNGYTGEGEETEITAALGGGVYNNGTFTMGADVRIHNNQATEKGDDVYNVEGASLKLIDEPEEFGLILIEDNRAIDGWYYDGKGDTDTEKDGMRWDARVETPDENLYYNQEKENLERTDEVALKAAHGLEKYTVTINFLEEGSNKVLREQVVTDPVRENKPYDVSQYEKTLISGYTYVRTDGDAYIGTLDGNKIINLYYCKAETGSGNTDDSDNPGNMNNSEMVDTGDHSNIMMWSIISMLSVLGIMMSIRIKRRIR